MKQPSPMPEYDVGAPLAQGRTASIHPWTEGWVVKLFRTEFGRETAAAERRNLLAAAAAGVAVPRPGDVVMLDGRVGLTMEAVAGPSMMERIMQAPGRLESFARELADLHLALHRLSAPAGIPPLARHLRGKIERAAALAPAERKAALRALAEMPAGNAFCHGDFHPGNLLVSPRGPVVIDWSDAGCGPPMADVARTSLLFSGHIALAAASPSAQAPMRRFHDAYLAHRLAAPDGDAEEVRRWFPVLAAARLAEGIAEQTDWLREQVRPLLGAWTRTIASSP